MSDRSLSNFADRSHLLVQSVTDYAIYMLDPEGTVISWNAGAQRFKGYTADEIIGHHFSRFYTEEEAGRGVPAKALATARDHGHFEAEGWRVRKDGSQFWANVVVDPIRDPEGRLIGFAKVTRDLTERRETQIALEKSREAFFQSQKMEAIGKLTGGVAHDFNNLLSAILGSLDLAERRLAAGEDASRFLANARSAAERGATLTQRMLAFARKQDLKIEPIDLPATVMGMAELLDRTIGPDLVVHTEFSLGLPRIHADGAQLELALLNLVVNARDAMPRGGDIRISGHRCPWPASGNDFVCLSVTDRGAGMDAETLGRAVEPFFTTKGVGKGTGLGLSMVQGMVEQFGGHFALKSELGKGTIAELWLPIADAEPAASRPVAPAKSAAREPARRCLNILAVDDDGIILMNTAMMLEDLGHKVWEAMSGEQALAVLGEQPIDLMLTDYAMPGMNGAELVEAARALRPGLAAIVVTGYAELPQGETFSLPKLAKPFTEGELAGVIATLGEIESGR